MYYVSFDIPDGTSLRDFLTDLSAGFRISPSSVLFMIKQILNRHDYYIRTYPVSGEEGKFLLEDLTIKNLEDVFNGNDDELINAESMIFKHKS